MIEIFKTDVRTKAQATHVLHQVNILFSEVQANFDLKDCDKILRLQGIKEADLPIVQTQLAGLGYRCELLH